ncbi:8-amino-7-oxononanoate synthase [Maribacter sp. HTCC2170]|uniref:8-amino-7-oxononanoate synthase n=1 Tax=Maribacter sp. (strain HTCC2170 / KCCM 42371) TaxID=313603 RepID=UPI00006B475A|nr:8-amino-7-oxononanoate synthase [Maribacter sp. HTCC2170]EAR01727.1 8-amino-7-oxononanoate synthase [Maribacter sp. HTCC2170]
MTHYIDGFPGRELSIDHKKYLYFGGTSYLGLQTDVEFQDLFIAKVRQYGTNYGASRKSNIRLKVFELAEQLLADLTGCESALTLSSGYLAGQFIAQHFNKSAYKLFYAPNTHSALYNNYNKPYTSFEMLGKAITEHLSKNKEVTPVVFIDSIDFDGCNYPHFEELKILPLDQTILVVDDSHGIGVIGENGSGVYKTLKKYNTKELVVCCSLGKGFGIQAGVVLGSINRVNKLQNSAFFGGASPAAPCSLATFIEAQSIYTSKRKQLRSNIELFRRLVKKINTFSFMEDHPSFGFENKDLSQYLEEHGFMLTNFNYPEESSTVMSRIVLSSHHHKNDIKLLTDTINQFI